MTQIIEALSDISHQYDAMFVDLWGCLHNGVTAYPEAVEALRAYRKQGGVVVLVTNSPRGRAEVYKQFEGFGIPDDCFDNIASSGDSARAAMFEGAVGRKVYFIGTEAELPFFEPMKLIENPVEVERVALEEAEGIVCTGLFDAKADPAEMRPQFLLAKQKGLKLLCANPDVVVDRGDHREWCAGALAALYSEMGGESLYFGKPHPPIYDLARRRLAEVAPDLSDPTILAIGDGVRTDIQGAQGEDIDSLFVTGGLAAEETRTDRQPHEKALLDFLEKEGVGATYSIGFLR
ncbi:MAG: TIGR01459 family HAD-type hydrolase [Rhodobacteraceae bacterium]|jgi:HAD superfamily hydrolase (TIGR01459 family)|uniref:HAD-superfamily class IIA hydrolase, TIGR01459 n=1 Tax=Salipiger profundus TaxID=1229727 RepID=A0A1U7D746_9RHOB|nr:MULTISPECIES: TIGR01459 family HAD-type hydrolase [Salipiger]APX23959.1 HAD-superfamily class IIA hydrolase, TIGR01459 [Salipiger profundus]MAB06759.1 TIGR01459 family HAD-type hydrolase [Paracoccaceae bacterium]GFZ93593.1 haloacid dehalogenase [Salipiger profundus]SFB95755.1 HAD-superfamily class IIA hydrolase, TIGR01459 [Salipiger profundus]